MAEWPDCRTLHFAADPLAALVVIQAVFDLGGCRDGQHGALIESDPIESGDAVNVESRCVVCGIVVQVVSWTRDAWKGQQDE